MTTQHTPGRLKIGERQRGIFVILEKIDECPVGGTFSPDDARRLVACWNACEGISTESLERGPSPAEAFQREQNRADLAERERDELLAALKLARGALRQAATDVSDWGAYAPAHFQTKHRLADDVQAYNNAADSAHAAIAKAEGGAA